MRRLELEPLMIGRFEKRTHSISIFFKKHPNGNYQKYPNTLFPHMVPLNNSRLGLRALARLVMWPGSK